MENLLTVEDLAALLKVSKSTIYCYIHSTGLPTVRIGRHIRFRQRDVELWIKAQQAQSAQSGAQL